MVLRVFVTTMRIPQTLRYMMPESRNASSVLSARLKRISSTKFPTPSSILQPVFTYGHIEKIAYQRQSRRARRILWTMRVPVNIKCNEKGSGDEKLGSIERETWRHDSAGIGREPDRAIKEPSRSSIPRSHIRKTI